MSSPTTWGKAWPINPGNDWQLEKIVVNIHGGFVKEFWMKTSSAPAMGSEPATVETTWPSTPLPNVDVEAQQVDKTTKKTKKRKKKAKKANKSKTWTVVDTAEADDGGQDDEEHSFSP